MKHDALCPTQGKILKTNCQCSLIARVRTDQQIRVDSAIDTAIDTLSQEYGQGFVIGYRTGRSEAADDLVLLLKQFNLPQMINVEYVIRQGIPKEVQG